MVDGNNEKNVSFSIEKELGFPVKVVRATERVVTVNDLFLLLDMVGLGELKGVRVFSESREGKPLAIVVEKEDKKKVHRFKFRTYLSLMMEEGQ